MTTFVTVFGSDFFFGSDFVTHHVHLTSALFVSSRPSLFSVFGGSETFMWVHFPRWVGRRRQNSYKINSSLVVAENRDLLVARKNRIRR